MHFVSMITPAFEAQYAASSGIAHWPAIDAVERIEPPPRAARCSQAALAHRKTDFRFVASSADPTRPR